MYRAVTWLAVSRGVPPQDPTRMDQLLHFTDFQCGVENRASTIRLDGVDPTPYLVDEEVNKNVSAVASHSGVRRVLVAKQRVYANDADIVMEGRDIGSAVFPETPFKFYIDASPDVRAMRRAKQGLQDSIANRDKIDSSRRASPLTIAEDAHVIDSSNLTVEGVVGEIFGRLKQNGLPLGDL